MNKLTCSINGYLSGANFSRIICSHSRRTSVGGCALIRSLALISVLFFVGVQSAFSDLYCPVHLNSSITMCSVTADIEHKGGVGEITVYASSHDGQNRKLDLDKVLIIVKGYQHDVRSSSILKESRILKDLKNGGLYESLMNEGYDIIEVGYNYPADVQYSIQQNSLAFVKLLQNIFRSRTSTQNLNQPMAILGLSLGGLISRYALAYMDKHKIPYSVHVNISYDTPHRGANIPVGVQEVPYYLYDGFESLLQKSYGSSIDRTKIKSMQNKIRGHQEDLEAIIPRQTLINYRGEHPSHASYTELYTELNQLGHPKDTRNVAFTNGSLSGVRQSGIPSDIANNVFLDFDTKFGNEIDVGLHVYNTANNYGGGCDAALAGELGILTYITCLEDPSQTFPAVAFAGRMSGPADDEWDNLMGERIQIYTLDMPASPSHRPVDGVPGGYGDAIVRIAEAFKKIAKTNGYNVDAAGVDVGNTTFVPTVSALDIDLDYSANLLNLAPSGDVTLLTPFDKIYGSSSGLNEKHGASSSIGRIQELNDEIITIRPKRRVRKVVDCGMRTSEPTIICGSEDFISWRTKRLNDDNAVLTTTDKSGLLETTVFKYVFETSLEEHEGVEISIPKEYVAIGGGLDVPNEMGDSLYLTGSYPDLGFYDQTARGLYNKWSITTFSPRVNSALQEGKKYTAHAYVIGMKLSEVDASTLVNDYLVFLTSMDGGSQYVAEPIIKGNMFADEELKVIGGGARAGWLDMLTGMGVYEENASSAYYANAQPEDGVVYAHSYLIGLNKYIYLPVVDYEGYEGWYRDYIVDTVVESEQTNGGVDQKRRFGGVDLAQEFAFTGCGASTKPLGEKGEVDLRLKTLHPSTANKPERDQLPGYGRCFGSAKPLDSYDGYEVVASPTGDLYIEVMGVKLRGSINWFPNKP